MEHAVLCLFLTLSVFQRSGEKSTFVPHSWTVVVDGNNHHGFLLNLVATGNDNIRQWGAAWFIGGIVQALGFLNQDADEWG